MVRVCYGHCFFFICCRFNAFFTITFEGFSIKTYMALSDSTRHRSWDICPPISQIVLKNFIKISLIIKECPEEIMRKLAIVLKISMSS